MFRRLNCCESSAVSWGLTATVGPSSAAMAMRDLSGIGGGGRERIEADYRRSSQRAARPGLCNGNVSCSF